MLMGMFTSDNGLMIRQTERGHIFPNVALNMSVIGSKISKMAKGNRLGLTKLSIMAIIRTEKNTGKESSCGLTIVHSKEIFMRITFMVSEGINGKTAEFTKVNG